MERAATCACEARAQVSRTPRAPFDRMRSACKICGSRVPVTGDP